MHGVLKVRTTEEQRLRKEKEQQKKLAAYQAGLKQILSSRKKDSYDPISLSICTQILIPNPDIYTLWNYRKEVVLIKLKEREENIVTEDDLIQFLENEISLTEQCLLANPKSYGAWHHRFWILEHHPKPNWQKEFDLCTKYSALDDRNFHCWDYRRQIVNKIGISLAEELKFSTDRINVDFSNYSSWHYRSTLRKLDKESIDSELTLVQNAVFTDPSDSSTWIYLRWVLSNPDVTKQHKEELVEALDQLLELEPDCKWIWIAKCWLAEDLCANDENYSDKRAEYYRKLKELDPTRKGRYEDYLKGIDSKQSGDK